MSMSILLQNLETLQYVGRPSGWTDRPEQAREFGGGTVALFYCHQHQLKYMRMLGRFDDPRENFTIRLPDFSTAKPPE
jgi:hypothetical protein